MTAEEAVPYHLCLRLGVLHPDLLDERLTAGQWQDWLRYDSQFNLAIGRDDVLWALSRLDYVNNHLPAGEMPRELDEVCPYLAINPLDGIDGDETRDQFFARIGIGTRFRVRE